MSTSSGASEGMLAPLWTNTSWGAVYSVTDGEPHQGEAVIAPGLGVSVYLRASVSSLAAAGYRAWLADPPGFGDSEDPPRKRLSGADINFMGVDTRRYPADFKALVRYGSALREMARPSAAAPAPGTLTADEALGALASAL